MSLDTNHASVKDRLREKFKTPPEPEGEIKQPRLHIAENIEI